MSSSQILYKSFREAKKLRNPVFRYGSSTGLSKNAQASLLVLRDLFETEQASWSKVRVQPLQGVLVPLSEFSVDPQTLLTNLSIHGDTVAYHPLYYPDVCGSLSGSAQISGMQSWLRNSPKSESGNSCIINLIHERHRTARRLGYKSFSHMTRSLSSMDFVSDTDSVSGVSDFWPWIESVASCLLPGRSSFSLPEALSHMHPVETFTDVDKFDLLCGLETSSRRCFASDLSSSIFRSSLLRHMNAAASPLLSVCYPSSSSSSSSLSASALSSSNSNDNVLQEKSFEQIGSNQFLWTLSVGSLGEIFVVLGDPTKFERAAHLLSLQALCQNVTLIHPLKQIENTAKGVMLSHRQYLVELTGLSQYPTLHSLKKGLSITDRRVQRMGLREFGGMLMHEIGHGIHLLHACQASAIKAHEAADLTNAVCYDALESPSVLLESLWYSYHQIITNKNSINNSTPFILKGFLLKNLMRSAVEENLFGESSLHENGQVKINNVVDLQRQTSEAIQRVFDAANISLSSDFPDRIDPIQFPLNFGVGDFYAGNHNSYLKGFVWTSPLLALGQKVLMHETNAANVQNSQLQNIHKTLKQNLPFVYEASFCNDKTVTEHKIDGLKKTPAEFYNGQYIKANQKSFDTVLSKASNNNSSKDHSNNNNSNSNSNINKKGTNFQLRNKSTSTNNNNTVGSSNNATSRSESSTIEIYTPYIKKVLTL